MTAIGRPDGELAVRRTRRHAVEGPAREVGHPDVLARRLLIAPLHHDVSAIGRDRRGTGDGGFVTGPSVPSRLPARSTHSN